MKTGNIILFSILGSFSILIIAGALELRLFGKRNNGDTSFSSDMMKETNAGLNPFHVLVIRESINVAIEKGDSLLLQVYRSKYDSPPLLKFHQSADTLFIDQIAFGENGNKLHAVIQLTDMQALKVIHAGHSTFSMRDIDVPTLTVKLNESRFYVTSELKIRNLTISAINSYVMYNSDIPEKLEADLDHSEVNIQGSVSLLSGSIRNNSDLRLRDIHQITFSKDSTSSVQIMN